MLLSRIQSRSASEMTPGGTDGAARVSDRPEGRFPPGTSRIVLLACAVFVAAAMSATAVLTHLYRSAIEDAEQDFSNLALVLANYSENTFRSVDMLQDGLVAMIAELGIESAEQFNELLTTSEVNNHLQSRILTLPQIEAVFFTNSSGSTIASTRAWPQPVFSIVDRPHFLMLRDNPEMASYIAPPARNAQTGSWNLYITRRLTSSSGVFLGVVGVGLGLKDFEAFFGSIALGTDSAIAMWRRDGTLMARYPQTIAAMEQRPAGSAGPHFLAVLQKANSGIFRRISPLDGIDRLVAVRALENYPLAIAVSRSVGAILAIWWQQVAYTGVALALVAMACLGIVAVGLRYLRGRDALERSRTAVRVLEEHRRSAEKIAFLAHHDPLTGLANRTLFQIKLDEAVARAKRGYPCAVLCIDLDHFKDVNDTLGHPMGDTLLRIVTERIKATVRETDTIARLGGDEFAIVQTGVEQPRDADELAQRLVETIAAPYDLSGNHVLIGASIGIAVAPGDGLTAEALIGNADMALYRSKAAGRGRYCFFEPEMNTHAQSRLAMLTELRRALQSDEFELHYQPQVRLPSREIVGFEALLRWRQPQGGYVMPDRFMALAEESALIVPLGAWVLRRACQDAAAWPGAPRVAVNISAVQFGSTSFMDTVMDALQESGLDPSRLELEITETVLLRETDATLARLHRLRAMGISIALDDFGTGYSSLSYLQRFPFDRVKLDRSFILQLGHARTSDAIVRCVIGLCEALDISITAEGIETEQQCDLLASGGCDEAQGHLFGRPAATVTVPALVCARRL